MKPSEKTRNFIMWISSPKLIKYAFMVSGIIIVIILGILALSMNGEDSNSRRIEKLQELQERGDVIITDDGTESGTLVYIKENGAQTTISYGEGGFVVCLILMAVFGITFIIVAPICTGLVAKGLQHNIVIPESNNEKIDFHSLCQKCSEINADDNPYIAEAHESEGWIDVTWRWKDSVDLGASGIDKNTQIFYKLFKVYPDGTYTDIDMTTTTDVMLGLSGIGLWKTTYLGHIGAKKFEITLSKPKDDNVGLHEYTLDTTEMTNYMHEWFTKHGYKYKNWI